MQIFLEKNIKMIIKLSSGVVLAALLLSSQVFPVSARENSVFGIHLLHPAELEKGLELIAPTETNEWHYVTIPLSLEDIHKDRSSEWQDFFRKAKEKKVIPIVRLVTTFDNGAWAIPTKGDIVDIFAFLGKLDWPSEKKYIIVFNEVNHANEWGGNIDPENYADLLRFTANWAHSEEKNYQILPAAMDLGASNGAETREAFEYLNAMLAYDPHLFEVLDYWNSHSYPNPGFSASPEKTDKKSLRGYTYELAYLKNKSNRELQTFITETGWEDNSTTHRWLSAYYQYAADQIWTDERIVAVTPFILQGAPGPFTRFSFVDQDGHPTAQYHAYQDTIKRAVEKHLAETH